MLHETNNKKITVEDMTVDFQSVYREEYFPKDLLNEIGKANMLIIPNYFSREGHSGYVFLETTQEFLGYAQEKACDEFIPENIFDIFGHDHESINGPLRVESMPSWSLR